MSHMTNMKTLTTREVARLCCVSDATVKRWDDAKLLRSERTRGGHRRFRAEDVAQFRREMKLGVRRVAGDPSVASAKLRPKSKKRHSDLEIFHALVSASEDEASGILINHFLRTESLPSIFDEQLCPALRRVGELWYEGEISVADEHLATRTALCSLFKLRAVLPVVEREGKAAVCCAVEGDYHELPTHFVQMALEQAGWDALNFGANLPMYTLADEIETISPQLICISSTVIFDLDRLTRDFASIRQLAEKQGIPIMLGGRGFRDPEMRKRFPADFYPESFSEAVSMAASIH